MSVAKLVPEIASLVASSYPSRTVGHPAMAYSIVIGGALLKAGTIGAVVAAGFAWREGYWNRPRRLHYSLVAIIALVFA